MSIYGFDQNTKSEGAGNFAGIQEGFKLVKPAIESASANNSQKILAFRWKKGDYEFTERVFPLNEQSIRDFAGKNPQVASFDMVKYGLKKGDTITPDIAVKKASDEFNARIKHIATKYMTEDEAVVPPARSWEDYMSKVVALYTDKVIKAAEEVRLKLVYNKKGYLSLPPYPDFIERMSIPLDKSKLKIGPKDIVVKPNPDADKATTTQTTTTSSGAEVSDEF